MLGAAGLEGLGLGAVPVLISALSAPDEIMRHELADPMIQFLGITSHRGLLIWAIAVFLLVTVVRTGFLMLAHYTQVRFAMSLYLRWSQDLVKAYLGAPYVFHLGQNTADLLRNLTQETMRVANGVVVPLLELCMHTVLLVAVCGVLFWVKPLIAAFVLVVLGGGGGGFLYLTQQAVRKRAEESQHARGEVLRAANEGLGAVGEVKVMGREAFFRDAFIHQAERTASANRYLSIVQKSVPPVLELGAIASFLGVSLLLVIAGEPLGEITGILGLLAVGLLRVRNSVSSVVRGVTRIRQMLPSLDVLYEDLRKLAPKGVDSSTRSPKRAISEGIAVEGGSFRYPATDEYALRDVSLHIPAGASVGFVGPTGSGKTTAVNVLLGLLPLDEGRVLVDGEELQKMLNSERVNVGYIPQSIYLCDDTIRRNVAMGIPEKEIDDVRLRDALQEAQLYEFVAGLPDGMNTVVGERGVRLSGGQRQRVGIARALYGNPSLVVADEGTSALDAGTEAAIVEIIQGLRGQRTVLMIAHRMSTIRRCDRIYYFDAGRIIAAGTYEELARRSDELPAMAG